MILTASRIECGICFCQVKMGERLHVDTFMDVSGVQVLYGKCTLCFTQNRRIANDVDVTELRRSVKNRAAKRRTCSQTA